MSFGANLEMMRRKLGIQIYKLESYCGIPQQRLKDFESDRATPTLTEILALSYVFSTTPQVLLDMADQKKGNQAPAQNQVTQKAESINSNSMQAPKAQAQTQASKKDVTKTSQNVPKGQNKKNAHKNADWKVCDVTDALQQLQVGTQELKPADVKSQQMDPEKIKQEAIAHVATSAPKGKKEEAKQQVEKQPTKQNSKSMQATDTQKVDKKQQSNNKAQSNSKSFGEKMKDSRAKLNLSYTKICKQLGIKTIEYVQIEAGTVQPNAELKAKICDLLEIE